MEGGKRSQYLGFKLQQEAMKCNLAPKYDGTDTFFKVCVSKNLEQDDNFLQLQRAEWVYKCWSLRTCLVTLTVWAWHNKVNDKICDFYI